MQERMEVARRRLSRIICRIRLLYDFLVFLHSRLTSVTIISISLLLTVSFPSRSEAWNWNFRATSVVDKSNKDFLRTIRVCGSRYCHRLAYRLLSSKHLYSDQHKLDDTKTFEVVCPSPRGVTSHDPVGSLACLYSM